MVCSSVCPSAGSSLGGRTITFGTPKDLTLTVNNKGGSSARLCIVTDSPGIIYSVKSSNSAVAGAYAGQQTYYDTNGVRHSIPVLNIVSGMKTGSAVITVTATDGTKRSATVRVTVK